MVPSCVLVKWVCNGLTMVNLQPKSLADQPLVKHTQPAIKVNNQLTRPVSTMTLFLGPTGERQGHEQEKFQPNMNDDAQGRFWQSPLGNSMRRLDTVY